MSSSWSSSESEMDEEESNTLIRHYRGSVICFNLRSFKRYSKACTTKENLIDDKISERFSGGAIVARIHMDGCVKGTSRPWMTVHQNSSQVLNTPIIFDDIFIRKEDAARVVCFVKNYANRGGQPIKRFCEFKLYTPLEAQVFFETYKKIIKTIVGHPRYAITDEESNKNEDEVVGREEQEAEVLQPKVPASAFDYSKWTLLDEGAVDDDYYDDEDFDDLCEDTQNPFA